MTKIIFMGTPIFSVPILKQLLADGYEIVAVVTQPDRCVGRKQILTAPPVKITAIQYGIPVIQPEKIRERESLAEVLAYEPDLIITAAFGQILPKELLEFPKFGCINVHASLLPELRGGAPIHTAIIQGKTVTGVTIMYMVEKLDAGAMISKVETGIEETDNAGTLYNKLSIAGAKLLSETLPKLLKREITPVEQNHKKASYAPNITRKQEKIDWFKKGEIIYNQIRGLNPWPGAYTTINEDNLKVWAADKIQIRKKAMPGTIIAVENDVIVVKTSNYTAIALTELQLAGKKKMPVSDILRGKHPFEVGTLLGEFD